MGAVKKLAPAAMIIRNCCGLEELRSCVALQKEVWKFSDADLVPLRMFVVAEKIGGQVIGAFVRKRLAGFSLSLPGIRDGKSYLHSHMLAVSEEYRNAGLGRKLKLFQRKDAIQRGFDLIEWTFDPLEIKNAYFNIERLGAIARRYSVDQYGTSSSPLQGGLPTDRLIAEWWLKSDRVNKRIQDRGEKATPAKRIFVPAEIYQWKASPNTRKRAKTVQKKNRLEFMRAFSSRLAVLGYERDENGNGAFLLGRWR
ncbi:MAG TPA: GNAT family N-acetyltransferase [Terriglobales bacterium]|jgi:predicted GNAT superfamily acetyltransferase